jgi:hypothetical protein
MAPRTFVVKRQFGVWLEDAFEVVLRPEDEREIARDYDGHVNGWVDDHLDVIYARANDRDDGHVTLMWEDEHKLDLDFPEGETHVEAVLL